MKLDSQFVGTSLKPYRTKINWRDTMNFAAAIGDHNSIYFDDEALEGIIAPPMFSVAITWPVIENLAQFLASKDFPHEVLLTQVHYTEHLMFHRPIRPDEELTIQGKVAAIIPHRAGTHVIIRFEARDQDQKLVFTEHNGGMMRGVYCRDTGGGTENIPEIPTYRDNNQLRWKIKIPLDPMLPFIYDGCTNIVFPIHTSRKFARQVGLPDIILQGTATLALAVRELIHREAGDDPCRLKEIYCRFTGMVFPNSVIKLRVHGTQSEHHCDNLFFEVFNQDDEKVLSKGYALISK